MTILVFFIILGYFCGATIGFHLDFEGVDIFGLGLLGCMAGIILFSLFVDSPLNMEDANAVYELQTINPNSYYTVRPLETKFPYK